MGVVYEAREAGGDRKVALKLIRDAHLATREDVNRFTLEAEAAARLDHPNIVRIHQVGQVEGQPFFSMDLIEGESMYVKILRGDYAMGAPGSEGAARISRQCQETIARLISKIARAVHHAHERGILHRDLKPGNILIDARGEPHLTDFGLAKILHPSDGEQRSFIATTPGDLLGTPNYMAPEQISRGVNTRASDLYSLGAMFYELLTGRPPFDGTTTLDMLRQIAEQPPIQPRWFEPSVARDLETICLKCLEKDPRHRFVSADALADDLDRWLAGQPINARRPSIRRRVREWTRRNPVGAAFIASLFLGLSIAVFLLKTVNDQRHEIERDRDQTFEEGMAKVSLLWKDPNTREVSISAFELAIMAGRPLKDASHIQHQLCFGISTGGEPSSTAQLYSRWLSYLQEELQRALGERAVFRLKLFKQSNQDEESLAGGDVDFMVLSAVDYLNARRASPGVMPIARLNESREAVIFARTNSGVLALAQLAGKVIVFPDSDLTMSTWAKARLAEAGLHAADFQSCIHIEDQGLETDHLVIGFAETVHRVLRREADAGVTYRERFERYKHLGLVMLDCFPETPNVLAARQGLDPGLLEAFRTAVFAVERKAKFDSLTIHGFGPMVPAAPPEFDPVRRALQLAGQFDGQAAVKN